MVGLVRPKKCSETVTFGAPFFLAFLLEINHEAFVGSMPTWVNETFLFSRKSQSVGLSSATQ